MRLVAFRKVGWRAVALLVVGSVAGAAVAPLIAPPVFRAEVPVQLVQVPSSRIVLLNWNGRLESQLALETQSLASLVNSRPVISAVIARRHLRLTGPELASKISTDVPSNSPLLYVRVTDPDRKTAVTLARAVTGRFAVMVRTISRRPGGLRVAIGPRTSVLRVRSSRVLAALIGAVCGLIVAALIAMARGSASRLRRTARRHERSAL